MRNIIGQAVVGDDLYGRDYELARLWEHFDQGEHVLMLAPRRVGKTSLMLELHRSPRENWDVINVDVQGGSGPEDCVAALLAALAAEPRYRTRFEAVPFSSTIRSVLEGVSANVDLGVLRVELKRAIGHEWDRVATQLQDRLINLPQAGRKLLIILDELPILISRMLRVGDRSSDADLLLARLRQWRQTPAMRGTVHTLVGGSIGLEGVCGAPDYRRRSTTSSRSAWTRGTALPPWSSSMNSVATSTSGWTTRQSLGSWICWPIPFRTTCNSLSRRFAMCVEETPRWRRRKRSISVLTSTSRGRAGPPIWTTTRSALNLHSMSRSTR